VNIPRVIKFALLLFVIRVLLASLQSGPNLDAEITRTYVLSALAWMYLPDALVVILVLAIFARVQMRMPYVHSLSLIALNELLAWAVLFVAGLAVGIVPSSSPLWPVDYVVLIVSATIGTAIGISLRGRRMGHERSRQAGN
jgi:hypothetical protein